MDQSILMVAKENVLHASLREAFHALGYVIWETDHIDEAVSLTDTLTLSAVLIDLDTPIDGLELCKRLRQVLKRWEPIILLSSDHDELSCTLGLELGADDYVLKPFSIKELIARIKAIMRRSEQCCRFDYPTIQSPLPNHHMVNGELVIDSINYTLYKHNQLVDLTRKEFELLYYLFTHKGEVVTRKELLKALSSESDTIDDRIIDVFISRLRQKIEPKRKNPIYIKTIRGIGYLLVDYNKYSLNETSQIKILN
ncbi:response regulator transcription factor [Amphibacillus jilinensis]|uniref:response regulator transcription factor n=1 Tax=Amphibacillus jilinensis TaxID=1216008 RepID=UPI0002D6C651|nr:response regulator transcription factor [Amphibacillus jilinensis]